jgi:hypothetical protein
MFCCANVSPLLGYQAGQSTPKWQLPVEVRVRSKFRQAGEGGSLVKVVPLDAKRIYKAKKITESAYTSHITLLKGGIAGDLPLLASYVSISRGFRHQIRAHLAHVGLAIVGDSKYGSPAGFVQVDTGPTNTKSLTFCVSIQWRVEQHSTMSTCRASLLSPPRHPRTN